MKIIKWVCSFFNKQDIETIENDKVTDIIKDEIIENDEIRGKGWYINDIITTCFAKELPTDNELMRKNLDEWVKNNLFSRMNDHVSIPLFLWGFEFLESILYRDIRLLTSRNFHYNSANNMAILYVPEIAKYNDVIQQTTKRSELNKDYYRDGKISSDVIEGIVNVWLIEGLGYKVESLSIMYLCVNDQSNSVDSFRVFSSEDKKAQLMNVAKNYLDIKIDLKQNEQADSDACYNGKRCGKCPMVEYCKENDKISNQYKIAKKYKDLCYE